MIEQRCEPSVPRPVAESGAPGEALDAGREVAVSKHMRQAEVRKVHLGELLEEDLNHGQVQFMSILYSLELSMTCWVWLHSVQKSKRIRTSFAWK